VIALERAARSARRVEEREHLLEAIEVLQPPSRTSSSP
jgi:hypothetical protein